MQINEEPYTIGLQLGENKYQSFGCIRMTHANLKLYNYYYEFQKVV
jgi:hypothetical protein